MGRTTNQAHSQLLPENQPHARGENPLLLMFSGSLTRNTPTHVGRTLSCHKMAKYPLETPPRTWGELIFWAVVGRCLRNTPTHVGRTARGLPYASVLQKHPHARGENTNKVLYIKGSKTLRFHFSFIFATLQVVKQFGQHLLTYYHIPAYLPNNSWIFRNLSNS